MESPDLERAKKQFRIASAFADSVTIMRGNTDYLYGYISVVVVGKAFASEIFIKTILTMMGVQLKKGSHDLKELFDHIPNQDANGNNPKDIIESYYNESIKPFNDMLAKTGMKEISIVNLDKMLSLNRNNFREWRYKYEKDPGEITRSIGSGLEDFCFAMQRYILTLQPDWEKYACYKRVR